jgi:hypothetical protein
MPRRRRRAGAAPGIAIHSTGQCKKGGCLACAQPTACPMSHSHRSQLPLAVFLHLQTSAPPPSYPPLPGTILWITARSKRNPLIINGDSGLMQIKAVGIDIAPHRLCRPKRPTAPFLPRPCASPAHPGVASPARLGTAGQTSAGPGGCRRPRQRSITAAAPLDRRHQSICNKL